MSSRTQLDVLAEEVLPSALGDLASRHDSARELVQYLEDRYMQRKHLGEDPTEVEEESHSIMIETLGEVANDIERITCALDRMLSLESDAITTLTQRINLASSRIRLNEERYSRNKLEKVRITRPTQIGQIPEASSLIDCGADQDSLNVTGLATHERLSIAKRLNGLRHLVYPELQQS